MNQLHFNNTDKNWLLKNQPTMILEEHARRIVGMLEVDMIFDPETQSCTIDPIENVKSKYNIRDQYQIEILFEKNSIAMPKVYETSGRLKAVANSKNIRLDDLHINSNNSACLCIKTEEDYYLNTFSFKKFFSELVIPFFYSQSFFEKNNFWPWGEYSHGTLGLLEWYSNQNLSSHSEINNFLRVLKLQQNRNLKSILIQKNVIKLHNSCLCGNGKKFKNCRHQAVFKGLLKLQKDIKFRNYSFVMLQENYCVIIKNLIDSICSNKFRHFPFASNSLLR